MKRIWILSVSFVLAIASIPEGMAQVQSGPELTLPTWSHVLHDPSNQIGITCFTVNRRGTAFAGTGSRYLLKSINLGATWLERGVQNGLDIPFGEVDALASTASGDVFVGCERGVYKSTDDGESFRKVDQGSTALFVTKNGTMFSGSGSYVGSSVRTSTDGGNTWTVIADSIFTSASGFTGFAEARNGDILATTQHALIGYGAGIFRSKDRGRTWTKTSAGLSETNFVGIISDPLSSPERIFAMGYSNGLFSSEDGGTSWFPVAEIQEKHGGTVFATSQGSYFGYSILNREAVYQFLSSAYRPLGFPVGYMIISGCQLDDRHILFGTNDGIWMATYPAVTAVEKDVPISFSLSQNYPNPFNPSTTIKFEVLKQSFVNISVFNILGQEVKILVNEMKPMGSYEVSFNASNLPSGTYLYRMQCGSFTETRRMVLVK